MFTTKVHNYIFIFGMCALAIGLPVSPFLISVAMITLTVNWLLQGNFNEKWLLIKKRKSIWIISVFYIVHLIALAYSSDINWGLHDLRIKLPLFVLPFIIGTSQLIDDKHIKWILYSFTASVFIHSIICIYLYIRLPYITDLSPASLTDFIDRIRFSLMVNMSIFTIFWLYQSTCKNLKWLYIPLVIWLIIFLFMLKSFTGMIIFILVAFILIVRKAYISNKIKYRCFYLILAILIIVIPGIYFTKAYFKFFAIENINFSTIDKYTMYGNKYENDFNDKAIENGHYINLYFCEPELRLEWNKRSKFAYDSLNRCNQFLKYPLIRYLTSKGLRKDKYGVDHLTSSDINNIEWGMTNYIYDSKYGIYPKIYTTFWELYNYHNGSNPTGGSISQRIESLKNAMHIIRKNFWFGVGTGDVSVSVAKQYKVDNSPLSIEKRIGPHNQWVTFFMTFGIFGFLIIIWSLIAPIFIENKANNYLFILIMLIGFISFLDEDTLNTHVGVSFFAFFYYLFLFQNNNLHD